MKIQDIPDYVRSFNTSNSYINFEVWHNGFLFHVSGEWYIHQCHHTGHIAELLKQDGKLNVSFPSIGAKFYVELKEVQNGKD